MKLFRKIMILCLSAALLMAAVPVSAADAPSDAGELNADGPVAAEPGEEEPVSAVKEYTVFEAIKIRRDLLSKGGNYTKADYKEVSTFIINTSLKSIRYFTLSYDVGGYDTSSYLKPELLEPKKVSYKSVATLIPATLLRDGYVHCGWEYDGVEYGGGDKFKMPCGDVVMTPTWYRRCKVTYLAGDYDDIVGKKTDVGMTAEGVKYDLAEPGRFSRKGYIITGWHCENDGLDYAPNTSYKVPPEDVVFTAIWAPAKYTVTISGGNGNTQDKLTMTAVCGEDFVLPECEFVNEGKTFAGWKYNKVIYQPGESFKVPALIAGSKIVVVATWE